MDEITTLDELLASAAHSLDVDTYRDNNKQLFWVLSDPSGNGEEVVVSARPSPEELAEAVEATVDLIAGLDGDDYYCWQPSPDGEGGME